ETVYKHASVKTKTESLKQYSRERMLYSESFPEVLSPNLGVTGELDTFKNLLHLVSTCKTLRAKSKPLTSFECNPF
ncbi:unnamed protein product, partial [Arabidopsis halleri]